MQIHLAKPGGQKEGPYSLEQISQSISAGMFRDTDYWAWYEGLAEWVPLYRLLRGFAAAPAAAPAAETSAPVSTATLADSQVASAQLSDAGEPTIHSAVATSRQDDAATVTRLFSSAHVPATGLFDASAVGMSGPAVKAVTGLVAPASSASAEPDLFISKTTHNHDLDSAPQSSSPHPNPSFAAGSDVVTALVQAVAESEATAIPAGWAAGFQPSSNEEAVQRDETPASVNQSSPSITDHALVAPKPISEGGSRITPEADPPVERRSPSGLPFAALERIVIFSTGERQSLWASPVAVQTLRETIGEDPDVIRQTIPRDLIFNCDTASLLGFGGVLSDSVWQAIAARHPEVVEKQRRGASQVCVRTFRLEFGAVVILVLFYDNSKLGAQGNPGN